jgi:carbonic anhydrase
MTYVNLHRYGSDTCENLVLTCIDFRFCKHVIETLSYTGYRDIDLLTMPGGSNAVLNETSRETVFRALDIVIPAHKVKRMIIVDHTDCLAYGGKAAHPTPDEEQTFHANVLRQARDIVQSKYPSLEIVLMYADWEKLTKVEDEGKREESFGFELTPSPSP